MTQGSFTSILRLVLRIAPGRHFRETAALAASRLAKLRTRSLNRLQASEHSF
jgi:hypothetical protein